MKGYFKIIRGWMNEPYFKKERFTEREAYIWLLEQAVFKPQTVMIADKLQYLERGQCAFSLRFLAEKWQWNVGAIRRFLKRMKKCSVLDTANDTGITVITICNYEKIQGADTKVDTLINTQTSQRRHINGTKKKEGETKENKREKADSNFDFLKDLEDSNNSNSDNAEFKKVMFELQSEIGRDKFFSWFGNVSLVEVNEEYSYAKIAFGNDYVKGYVQTNFSTNIERLWKEANPKIDYIDFG